MRATERRAFYRKDLSSLYLPFYDKLCERLPSFWQPYSGMRSFTEQTALYAKGRTVFPIGPQFIVTKAKEGQSAHNYGCASDWAWFDGDKLMWLKKEDPLWQDYKDAIADLGLVSGASWGDVDHNELKINCDWPHVLLCYNQGGMAAAQDKIQVSLCK